MQEFIEFARSRNLTAAIKYAQTHFPPYIAEKLAAIRTVMALLAFAPSTSCPPYRRLYALERWKHLRTQFLTAFAQTNTLPTEPLLLATVRAGLSALRTAECGTEPDSQCPICAGPLKELGMCVPRAHHMSSRIYCRISGQRIGGEVSAGVGPNGNVYAYEVFAQNIRNGVFRDPRDRQEFPLNKVLRLYIM